MKNPTLFGPCAKRRTQAVLTAEDGSVFVAENVCLNPQPVCPRAPGEGYEKCKSVCQQVDHAEPQVIRAAGPKAINARLVITHTYACGSCLHHVEQAGIAHLVFVGAPDE